MYEPQVTSTQEWTPASSKRVEGSADSGELASAADLCDRIMCDDRVRGALAQRTAISRLPLSFEGGSEQAVKRLLEDGEFWTICPTAQIQQFHRWYAVFGIGLGRLEWVDDNGKPYLAADKKHLPRMHAWSTPKHLERDIDNRIWKSEINNRGERVEVTPGENGWLLWSSLSDRPWSQGAWRALRAWWLLKQYAVEDWARYSERHGQGTVVVKAPEKDAGTLAKRRKLVRELKKMGANGVVVLPPGHEIDLMEATARTHETFSKQINAADTGIAIALLGQNLTSEVKGGSFAAARIHENIADNILAEDAEALEEFIYSQVLVPWAIANYGDASAAPWPKYDTSPPEDNKPRIETWNLLLDTLEKANSLSVPFDFVAAAEQVAMPLRAGEEVLYAEPEEEHDNPYKVEQSGDKWAVIQSDSGEQVGEHDTEEDAEAHRRALEVNVEDTLRGKVFANAGCVHHQAGARPGEEAGQAYADAVADSMQLALALDLEPHLAELVRIVANCKGDYRKAQERIETYYRDKVHADDVTKLVKAGLTMVQLGGWAAVRDDAPEVL